MKVCSKCKKEKPPDDFYKDKRNKDGLYSICKECHKSKVYYNMFRHGATDKERFIKQAIYRARSAGIITKESIEDIIYNKANDYCPHCGSKMTYGLNSKYRPRLIIIKGLVEIVCNQCATRKF